MKRLALIASALPALASFNVTAQTPRSRAAGRADVHQRRRADHLQQLREVPPARRSGADVAAVVRGRAAVGARRSRARSWRARCRRGAPIPTQRLQMRNDISLSKAADRHHRGVGRWRRAAGQRRGPAAGAEVRRRLDRTAREPDYVLEMPVEFDIPAEGELGVQMFYSKVPFDARIASPRSSSFGRATARSCITPASSSSTFPKARRSSTAASSARTAR